MSGPYRSISSELESLARWQATITYRSKVGPATAAHDLVELKDLDSIIEKGPHWDTVEKIEVVKVNHSTSPLRTLEAAELLTSMPHKLVPALLKLLYSADSSSISVTG